MGRQILTRGETVLADEMVVNSIDIETGLGGRKASHPVRDSTTHRVPWLAKTALVWSTAVSQMQHRPIAAAMISSSSTIFVNVNILDGSAAAPFPGAVLVKGNRIEAVIPEGERIRSGGIRGGSDAERSRGGTILTNGKGKHIGSGATLADGNGERIAPDAVVIDGKGATLMPGLIEPHAHLSFSNMSSSVQLGEIAPEEHTLITAKHARVMLDHGFTACVSAASAKPRLDIAVRDWINAGEIPGPRLLAASPEMTVTGGLGDPSFLHLRRENFGWVCNGADEFRASARLMCREGVDTLKINISGDDAVPGAKAADTVMNDSEVEAVCEVARGRGKRVAAHVRSAESVKMALRHGVDILYHATLVDDDACALLEAQRERVFVAPTLGNLYCTLYEASPWGLTTELATARGAKRELTLGIDNMKELKRRGVRILPGGDYGFAWAPIGANARDIEHFVNLLGFSATEAIQAATRLGGEIMMMGAELGRIEAGYLADLLLVDGDPLQDVSILQRADKLLAIMKDGCFYKAPLRSGQ